MSERHRAATYVANAGHPWPVLYAAVALGGGLGGVARWSLGAWLHGEVATGFPWATLAVNVVGSLLIGLYAGRLARHASRFQALPAQLFFMTGFCGGFTTFSAFGLETLVMLQSGRLAAAAAYAGVSVPLWIGAAWAGYRLAAHGRWGAAR